ncbi:hypothetical protein [Methylacidimicrobium tartarophylax]|uniref:Uncharacterized protein n=1 Tax=Methylacidimicrobium tartarophylax TaxID=1041768 RepID=A0A5E6M9L6_9BACT|nr:hypothetical protein [Methylacidimicrobium tartarophylax]VVM05898.1 hypothetical protein MAMT_00856 [Methylacidimicrobium tartarophylax]
MLNTLLTPEAISAPVGTQAERAGLVAGLFLLALVIGVVGAFVWAGYRLLKRERTPPPAYAEFLNQDIVEEVDAET